MKSTRMTAVHTVAAILPAAVFAINGGLTGVAWAAVTLGGATILPVPLAFVLGQFGVAATTPSGIPLLAAEAALAAILISDLTDMDSIHVSLFVGGVTAGLLAGIPLLFSQASRWTTLFYLTVTLSTILYGIHRYELYTTAQLQR